jgi:hypothetical protein
MTKKATFIQFLSHISIAICDGMSFRPPQAAKAEWNSCDDASVRNNKEDYSKDMFGGGIGTSQGLRQ